MTNLITISVFMGLGIFFVFFNLALAGLLRPKLATADKDMAYECGETPIGQSWVQFDLRFYIVALVFLVFDVEIALFYPWATIFNQFKLPALVDMIAFFVILMVGYLYLWRFGYLEWVRSSVTTGLTQHRDPVTIQHLKEAARKDPELVEP
jgi:NADH-quinone oxidoreductase subunit A